MKKITILLVALVTLSLGPLQVSAAATNSKTITNITELTEKLEVKREEQGFIADNDEDLLLLAKELNKLEITSPSYWTPETSSDSGISLFGYGQWHNLGKGWRARVDKPSHGGASKPHVHVENGNKKGVENVDGTASHGKTLGGAGVPRDIQRKARNLADYKKGQKDLANMKKAKSQIKAKNLDLRKYSDIIIATGIFISVVGLVLFAPAATATWGAFLLAI